jgi:hypothetical protein
MIRTVILFLSVTCLLAAADPTVSVRVKSMHLDRWPDTLYYDYDKAGRLTTIYNGHTYKTTYTYSGNTIIADTKGGSLVTMYLNSRGQVDSLTDIDTMRKTISTPNGDGTSNDMISLGKTRSVPYTTAMLSMDEISGVTTHGIVSIASKFLYDDAGYIREERIYLNGHRQIISRHMVQNGNIISYMVNYPVDTVRVINPKTMEEETKIIRQDDFIVNNVYDMSKMNTLMTNNLFGQGSKNVLVRSVRYDQVSRGDSTVTTYQYTYDNRSRITSLITTVKSTDPIPVNQDKEMEDRCFYTYY